MVIASMLPGTGITELSISPSRISPGPPSVKNQCLTTCAVVGAASTSLSKSYFIAMPLRATVTLTLCSGRFVPRLSGRSGHRSAHSKSHLPGSLTQRNRPELKTLPRTPWFRTDSARAPPPLTNPVRRHLNSYATSSNCVPGKVTLVVIAYSSDLGTLSLELCEKKRTRASFCAAQLTTAPHPLPLLFPLLIYRVLRSPHSLLPARLAPRNRQDPHPSKAV